MDISEVNYGFLDAFVDREEEKKDEAEEEKDKEAELEEKMFENELKSMVDKSFSKGKQKRPMFKLDNAQMKNVAKIRKLYTV